HGARSAPSAASSFESPQISARHAHCRTSRMPTRSCRAAYAIPLIFQVVACAAGSPTITAGDAPLEVRAGDVLRLKVDDAPDGASVTWSGRPRVKALAEGSEPKESILPQPSDLPTAYWLQNPAHYTDAELNGVLFVLDPGTKPNPTLKVTATIETGSTLE